MSDVLLNTRYNARWAFARSGTASTGLNPRVFVFSETSNTPMWTGTMTGMVGFTGVYQSQIPLLASSGFVPGASYGLWATGVASGGFAVREFLGRLNVRSSLFESLTGLAQNIYHAQIDTCIVRPSGLNRWTVLWFKNGQVYPVWSTGKLTIYDSGQNALFANSGLTAYSSVSGGSLIVGGALVLRSGERYIAQTSAFIDGATKFWQEHIGYDI